MQTKVCKFNRKQIVKFNYSFIYLFISYILLYEVNLERFNYLPLIFKHWDTLKNRDRAFYSKLPLNFFWKIYLALKNWQVKILIDKRLEMRINLFSLTENSQIYF